MKRALSILFFMAVCFSTSLALADNKVVVVPLFGGAVGDATTSDVIEGKTFSSKAGEGLSGTQWKNGDVVDKIYKQEYKWELRRKNRYGMDRWSKEKRDQQQG